MKSYVRDRQKLRIAILDDDTENVEAIKTGAKDIADGWRNVQYYTTPFALVTALCDDYRGDINLLMIHIRSGADEGIAVARDMQRNYPHIRVIFYSRNNDCAEEIFDADPLAFLRLPFRADRLADALHKAEKMCTEDAEQSIELVSRGQTQRLTYSSIRYVESAGRKMIFYTDAGEYEAYMLMSEVMEQLPQSFVQCHRSYIVNLDRVTRYGTDVLILGSGEMVPMSRSRQKEIRELLRN